MKTSSKHPLISIIVPLYNKAPYIENTIHSILSQGVSDFEIIIVNDGSTDEGAKKVSGIDDERIVLINQPNSGVSAARNRGIKEATGEWIYLLDADDCLMPNVLPLVVSTLTEQKCDILLTDYIQRDKDGHNQISHCRNNGIVKSPFKELFLGKLHICTGSIFVKREIASKLEFDENLSRWEDHKTFYDWMIKGKVQFHHIPLMDYNVNAANLSRVNQANYQKDYIFHLTFRPLKFWYNCNLGMLMSRGVREYPDRKHEILSKYGWRGKVYYLIAITRTGVGRLIRKFR